MKGYFAYTRVSTTKQGQQGVSLQEQRAVIERFAAHHGLSICDWYEEQQTAAKRGRPIFTRLLQRLRKGDADGLIVHKIDRGARNLRDWADLGDLIDIGVKVHFASDGLDLQTRGGRLSADIQAVVAADYIRNLREETKKGFYGRLKQGFYPMRAPLGYLDRGGGKPKEPDPLKAPLIHLAFELYASGQHSLLSLADEMNRRGLRTRPGGLVTANTLSVALNDSFYLGVIKIKRTGETFLGAHQPILRRPLFDRVQDVLHGRIQQRNRFRHFVFQKLWSCGHCHRTLIAETQKGFIYYRCHSRGCLTKCVREEVLDEAIANKLRTVELSAEVVEAVERYIDELKTDRATLLDAQREALRVRQGQLRDRMNRLTDALVEGLVDKSLFSERREALLLEQADLGTQESTNEPLLEKIAPYLELIKSPYLLYKEAYDDEKRELVLSTTSNRFATGKNGLVELCEPFLSIANRRAVLHGGQQPDAPRTAKAIVDGLLQWLKDHPEAAFTIPERLRRKAA